MPPFAAAMASWLAMPIWAAAEAASTIDPPSDRMAGAAARTTANAEVRLVAIVSWNSSGVVRWAGLSSTDPARFATPSRRPWRPTTSSTSRRRRRCRGRRRCGRGRDLLGQRPDGVRVATGERRRGAGCSEPAGGRAAGGAGGADDEVDGGLGTCRARFDGGGDGGSFAPARRGISVGRSGQHRLDPASRQTRAHSSVGLATVREGPRHLVLRRGAVGRATAARASPTSSASVRYTIVSAPSSGVAQDRAGQLAEAGQRGLDAGGQRPARVHDVEVDPAVPNRRCHSWVSVTWARFARA
jgi:hypothetical protein